MAANDASPTGRLAALLRTAIGSLVPCPLCRAVAAGAAGVCADCRQALLSASDAGTEYDRHRRLFVAWAGPYDGPHRRAVKALKFGARSVVAGVLAEALAQHVRQADWPVGAVVHVPLHPLRRARRGFDQAAWLAAAVARCLAVPHRDRLRRVRHTRRQARTEGAGRDRNVAAAFAPNGRLTGVPVLLVDDVWTTGATAAAAAAALTSAGAREVRVAVAARARPAGEVRLVVPEWARAERDQAERSPGATC